MPDLDAAQIEVEVERIMTGIYDGVKRVDFFDTWMPALHDPAGQWLLGMDVANIREASEELETAWTSDDQSRLERQEIDGLEIKVIAVSPTVAFALCTSPDRRWYYASGKVDRASTAETWVFLLSDEGWKIHSGQSALFPIED